MEEARFRCRYQAPTYSLKQVKPQIMLKLLEQAGDPWLGDKHTPCRTGNRAAFHDQLESKHLLIAKMGKLHNICVSSWQLLVLDRIPFASLSSMHTTYKKRMACSRIS